MKTTGEQTWREVTPEEIRAIDAEIEWEKQSGLVAAALAAELAELLGVVCSAVEALATVAGKDFRAFDDLARAMADTRKLTAALAARAKRQRAAWGEP